MSVFKKQEGYRIDLFVNNYRWHERLNLHRRLPEVALRKKKAAKSESSKL
jgi:hypothetical protein